MVTDLRKAFVDYCGAADRPEQREAAQLELTLQLDRLQLRLEHCHSAHECAKAFPEIGPLLTTIAHSGAVARCSSLTRTVIDTAAAYSKVQNTGTYANQRAARWFSQVLEWLLAAANRAGHGRICSMPGYVVVADQIAGRRYALQQLVALMAEERATWDMPKRQRVWNEAFALCCGTEEAAFLEYLVPALDDCGWTRLESHRLIVDYGVELATALPISTALRLWQRLEAVRAQLSAGVCRIFGAVLADEVLALQLLRDIARLVLATRDHRLVEMWKRVFRDSRCPASAMLKEGVGLDDLLRLGTFTVGYACVPPGARLAGEGGWHFQWEWDMPVLRACRADAVDNTKLALRRALGDQSGGNMAELFGDARREPRHLPLHQTLLWRQRCCVAAARSRLTAEDTAAAWLCLVALAPDDFAFRTLDAYFGRPSAEGLYAQVSLLLFSLRLRAKEIKKHMLTLCFSLAFANEYVELVGCSGT
ncbi:hypothetical protein H4R20_004491 [Coemansia guatemalensis]|uniref:Uncharacterized protein n=1 Tax=Coemansia guatemalensis TaxID=2761395 RepID=A0A9W8HRM2_9FUNG|nr:hypothetical protein H4R20_004491 [Coemansia guatemalensis]